MQATMRLLLLTHGFNGLTQRLYLALRAAGHELSIEFDIADSVTEEAVALWQPELLIAPYLKRRIPESVWSRLPCLVVHPGPPGDRGPSALDWALLRGECAGGVTVLQANAEYDAGPIWAWRPVAWRADASKSSVYRREVTQAAVDAVFDALARYLPGAAGPQPAPALPASQPSGRARRTRRARASRSGLTSSTCSASTVVVPEGTSSTRSSSVVGVGATSTCSCQEGSWPNRSRVVAT